jgi:hypothetical protein
VAVDDDRRATRRARTIGTDGGETTTTSTTQDGEARRKDRPHQLLTDTATDFDDDDIDDIDGEHSR